MSKVLPNSQLFDFDFLGSFTARESFESIIDRRFVSFIFFILLNVFHFFADVFRVFHINFIVWLYAFEILDFQFKNVSFGEKSQIFYPDYKEDNPIESQVHYKLFGDFNLCFGLKSKGGFRNMFSWIPLFFFFLFPDIVKILLAGMITQFDWFPVLMLGKGILFWLVKKF